jgi:outer membrane lipoprotein-sorting protein
MRSSRGNLVSQSRSVIRASTISQFPRGETTVSNGNQLWIYDPTHHVVYEGSSGSTSAASPFGTSSSAENQLTLNLIQPIFSQSNASSPTSTSLNGRRASVVHVTGRPSSSGTAPDYSGDVYIDPSSDLPLKMVLNLEGFAQVDLDFSLLTLNQTLPASLFSFTPPAGTRVASLTQVSATPTGSTLTLAQAEQVAGYHLLSIPSGQSSYQLEGVDVVAAQSGQVFVLHYVSSDQSQSFSIIEGKGLANEALPAGTTLSLRGTTATYSTSSDNPTLAWKEQGLGIRISGDLDEQEALKIANLLT